ncbi:MAG: AhpC/TSA family protein [Bacteroidetes bacterium]|nr:AhpC/TSA family protein [Bacteroidota bacterium]
MKNLLLLLICLPLLLSAQKAHTSILTGHLDAVGTGALTLRHAYDTTGKEPHTYKLKVKDGQFTVTTHEQGPRLYTLTYQLEPKDTLHKYIYSSTRIWLDSGTTTITGSADALETAAVNGSAMQNEWRGIDSRMESWNKQYKWGKGDSTAQALMKAHNDTVRKEQTAYREGYIKAHPASVISAELALDPHRYSTDPKTARAAYDMLDPAGKNTLPGRLLLKKINFAMKFDSGQVMTDIVLPDVNGHKVMLSSVVKKHKVVLLDFWASWCGPCRRENPHVVAAYREYKDKGFEIYSVSLDDTKKSWLAAIAKDSLIWTAHVSDLKGWNSTAAKKYGIQSIPTSYLICDGVIVARDLRGEELKKRLAVLLK